MDTSTNSIYTWNQAESPYNENAGGGPHADLILNIPPGDEMKPGLSPYQRDEKPFACPVAAKEPLSLVIQDKEVSDGVPPGSPVTQISPACSNNFDTISGSDHQNRSLEDDFEFVGPDEYVGDSCYSCGKPRIESRCDNGAELPQDEVWICSEDCANVAQGTGGNSGRSGRLQRYIQPSALARTATKTLPGMLAGGTTLAVNTAWRSARFVASSGADVVRRVSDGARTYTEPQDGASAHETSNKAHVHYWVQRNRQSR